MPRLSPCQKTVGGQSPQGRSLARRMIEDMTVRDPLPGTQQPRIDTVGKVSRHFDRSSDQPDRADFLRRNTWLC